MLKLSNSTIKKHLKNLTREELEAEILNMTKIYPIIQEHYFSILFPDSEEVLDKYKKIIEKEFVHKGEILRYQIMKQAIKDFSNVSTNKGQIAELMIFTVECGVDFTLSYGDIDDEKFYRTISSIFEQALKYIVDNQLEEEFVDLCNELTRSSQSIGWGFGDGMMELYSDYLGYLEEEDLD